MNIWSAWTPREFQQLINREDDSLLNRIEKIIPGLSDENFLVDNLYRSPSLKRIVEAFIPSDVFASSDFRFHCLNKLSLEELRLAAAHTGVGFKGSFETTARAIANQNWSEPFASRFVNHFEIPEHFLPAPKVHRPDSIDLLPATHSSPLQITSPFMQLIDYQFGVYTEAIKTLEQPRARMVIQMPTGSGKTRTAMEVVSKILNSQDDLTVVWMAHTRELCEQGLQCFKHVWPHHARKKVRIHRCWGDHKMPLPMVGYSNVIFAGFDKLNAQLKKNPRALENLRSDCRLIVVDEAHKTEAPTYKNAIRNLIEEETAVIGLTATPGRTYVEETEALSNFYFNRLIELPDPKGDGVIEMLRNRGVLSKAKYRAILTDINIPLNKRDRNYIEEKFKIPPRIIKMLELEDQRNLEILHQLKHEIEEGRRVLLFACSVDHSRFLNSCLLYLGFKSGHVDGSTNLARREKLIGDFRNGDLDVLCNFGVLTTGFDAPKTDTVMITRPTVSPVLYSQMIGRGLRGPLIGGTEFCRIIDVKDNIGEFGDADNVYRIFEDYWVETSVC